MPNASATSPDLSDEFPHLPNAPVVEAVIHWRARSEADPSRETWSTELKQRLPTYPKQESQSTLRFRAQVGGDGAQESSQKQQWQGIRCVSDDGKHIAQFNVDGLVVSRLAPYQDWDEFLPEALRLWEVYVDLAKPSEIQRLGVRYINRIKPVKLEEVKDWLQLPPRTPRSVDWPVGEFFHQDRYDLPAAALSVTLIQTFQPGGESSADSLIVDIDAFCEELAMDQDEIRTKLRQLRWAKNKTFFGTLTPEAINRFKESTQ